MDPRCQVECPTLLNQTQDAANQCTQKQIVKEKLDDCEFFLSKFHEEFLIEGAF
jgi:hypothetical protein